MNFTRCESPYSESIITSRIINQILIQILKPFIANKLTNNSPGGRNEKLLLYQYIITPGVSLEFEVKSLSSFNLLLTLAIPRLSDDTDKAYHCLSLIIRKYNVRRFEQALICHSSSKTALLVTI